MSRLTKTVKRMTERQSLKPEEIVTNFMGGESYKLDPIETLKIVTASAIFGEASYYHRGGTDGVLHKETDIDDAMFSSFFGETTTSIFEKTIDAALDYDFESVLQWAVELRNTYNMRLNPQVIMVRAALHPKRSDWTKKNPGKFLQYQMNVMLRADEPAMQATYFLYLNDGKKNNMPSILKRSIAEKLSGLNRYQINKYKNHEIGMINTIRLVHAQSPLIDELMRTGSVIVNNDIQTWEQKRSAGMDWRELVETTDLGHMAMLRNIRNVFTEIKDLSFCEEYMNKLVDGVIKGKQFPFRYSSAYEQIEHDKHVNHPIMILDKLEDCIDKSIENLPHLSGTTVCLSDNSGSAWYQTTTEYGTTHIAEIDNLSSVIAARCSDEGYVIPFGDKYRVVPVSKRNGVLSQTRAINGRNGIDVGHATEGGIWKFFRDAMDEKKHYDNIFIFSDMQAGTGGLYGTGADTREIIERGYISSVGGQYINVYKLIKDYRKHVNPKVNVFCIQTAGYNNVLIPQMSYRCAILTGWTGKEISFAAEYIRQWNEIEARRNINQKPE